MTFGAAGCYIFNVNDLSSKGGGEIRITKAMLTMSHLQNDPSRQDIAKRLARVAGHANSLKRLWEEGRDCDDMLTQIAAVRAGLDQVGKAI